jgi:hypothetical protein
LQGGNNVEPTESSTILGIGILSTSVVYSVTFDTYSGTSRIAREGQAGEV